MLAIAPVVKVDLNLLTFVSVALIPGLTALITKQLAPEWFKSLVLTVLAAVAGAVTTAINQNGNLPWETTLFSIGSTILLGFASHYGYNVTGLLDFLEGLAKEFGIGPGRVSASPRLRPLCVVPSLPAHTVRAGWEVYTAPLTGVGPSQESGEVPQRPQEPTIEPGGVYLSPGAIQLPEGYVLASLTEIYEMAQRMASPARRRTSTRSRSKDSSATVKS